MKPLIDSDILRYEIGYSGQFKDPDTGEEIISDFDRVAELLDAKIDLICEEVEATEEPTLYLTADKFIAKQLSRTGEFELKPNFRETIATLKPYKGTRKSDKPFHFYNLTAYMMSKYKCFIANGIEADDAMSIDQTENTIICSRDKDLRQVPGWHYSWECGKQPSIGPVFVEPLGSLQEREDGKVLGYGDKFFYYQMLVGDAVDNIGGVPRVGPKKALPLLSEAKTARECYLIVKEQYKLHYGDEWLAPLQENANLLWMVREVNKDGSPLLFRPPKS